MYKIHLALYNWHLRLPRRQQDLLLASKSQPGNKHLQKHSFSLDRLVDPVDRLTLFAFSICLFAYWKKLCSVVRNAACSADRMAISLLTSKTNRTTWPIHSCADCTGNVLLSVLLLSLRPPVSSDVWCTRTPAEVQNVWVFENYYLGRYIYSPDLFIKYSCLSFIATDTPRVSCVRHYAVQVRRDKVTARRTWVVFKKG